MCRSFSSSSKVSSIHQAHRVLSLSMICTSTIRRAHSSIRHPQPRFHSIVAMVQRFLNHPFGKNRSEISDFSSMRTVHFSNFITDCSNGRDEQICANCDFEKDTCRWLDLSIGPYSWSRDKAANVVQNSIGPTVDRTSLICPFRVNRRLSQFRYDSHEPRLLHLRRPQ